jgi:hypothetical protein
MDDESKFLYLALRNQINIDCFKVHGSTKKLAEWPYVGDVTVLNIYPTMEYGGYCETCSYEIAVTEIVFEIKGVSHVATGDIDLTLLVRDALSLAKSMSQ